MMIRIFLLLFVFSLGACGQDVANETAPTPTATVMVEEKEAPPSESYDQARASAIGAMNVAAERGHAWSTSDTLLEQAATAAAEGDESSAIRLADDARIQAELAVRQADAEEIAWRGRVLSN